MSAQSFEDTENQRKNPHLYTTMTQNVDPFGNIITLENVTKKITEAIGQYRKFHESKYSIKECGAMCFHQSDPICEAMRYLYTDYEKAAKSFVEHYVHMRERMAERDA